MRLVVWLCVFPSMVGCGDDAGQTPDAPPVDAAPGIEQDIELVARETLPSGSWLLANNWDSDPNTAFVIPTTDFAAPRRELFAANRVWSMTGASDGSTIWFSAFDKAQETHFGLTYNDVVQNTFAYDTATQTARSVAMGPWANVNDECHAPSRDGTKLYVCRRYDFIPPGASFSGWRLGAFTLADGSFEFIRPGDGNTPFELNPQELPGGSKLLFEMRARPPLTGSAIHTRDLATGTETMVRANATRPLLAPDGHRVLFRDTMTRRYRTLDLDQAGAQPVDVSPTMDPGSAAWSPDGNTIVYAVFDAAMSCDHLERVTYSGGTWSAPTRVRDCAITGEFITDISWLTVP
ncbi:MAG: hypothetical protein SFX73_04225 [Kofleriaceae bacterium]|nr:hypothetical protein [Kofleriaceae bacterium]